MQENSASSTGHQLHRALHLKDLVLLNISCIVSLSSLAQVAQFGFASLPLYILAILTFLIPSGLMVAELNARMPEEGGFYLWTRTAFGDLHGYIAAWTYWLSNIVWLPTVMLLVSVSCLYIFGDNLLNLADNPWYNGLSCLGILWLVTVLNILGMERAKWVQNIGGIATWITILLLLIVGILFIVNHASKQPFSPDKLVPDFSDFSLLPFFAIVAFCFGGLELAPVMAGEIQDPKRNIPRAIIISSIAVGLIYMAGTLMLLLTVPEGEVGIIEGVAQAFHEVSSAMHLSGIGIIGGLLVALSTMGLFGAWMTGTARVPFVIGLDHYLPDAFGNIHPKWGSPHISLLMQGVVLTLLFLSSIVGSTIKEAFLVLLDMSIILYFIPFLYMFAALVLHMKRNTGREGVITAFQKSRSVVWLVAVLGFGTTLFSTIISSVPTKDIENKWLFVVKVVGGAALLIGAGLIVYYRKRKESH
jgi:amino acid transporter